MKTPQPIHSAAFAIGAGIIVLLTIAVAFSTASIFYDILARHMGFYSTEVSRTYIGEDQ